MAPVPARAPHLPASPIPPAEAPGAAPAVRRSRLTDWLAALPVLLLLPSLVVPIVSRAATDTTAPYVADRLPAPATAAMPLAGAAMVRFSEPVVGVSTGNFVLRDVTSGSIVAGTVAYDSATRTASLQPSAQLAPGRQYQVALSSSIRDLAGNSLAWTSWTFTTSWSDAAPTPAAAFDRALGAAFEAGTHTGYRFSSTGAITASRTAYLSRRSSAAVTRRAPLPGHGGTWLYVANGIWADYWVLESSSAYLPGVFGKQRLDPVRTVSFAAGTHTGYKYSSTGQVVAARTATLSRPSGADAAGGAVANGRPHLFIANGIWAGYLVPESGTVRLVPLPAPPDDDPTPSPSPSPTVSPTSSPLPSPTASPSVSPTPTATASPSPTPPAGAFHVAPWGSDANTGTASAPWRTLQKAADSAPAGATVLIRSGTYAPFVITRSGTATSPTTFRGYPGDPLPVVAGNSATAYTIRISRAQFVTLSQLVVQGASADNKSAGIRVERDSASIELSDNLVRDNRGRGIDLYNSTSVRVIRNEITHNAKRIHVGLGTGDIVVADNRVHHNDRMALDTPDIPHDDHGAVGIGFNHTTGGVTATGNLLWGNRAPSSDYGYDGGAFAIHGASKVRIIGNTMWDNRNVLETGTNDVECADNVFARNVAYGAATVDRTVGMVLRCATDMLVANNTFHNLDHFVFALNAEHSRFGASISGLQIVNNVAVMATGKIYGIDSPMPASVVIDNNLVHHSSGGFIASVDGRGNTRDLETFTAWTGYEASGLDADPIFVDAAARDYRLAAGSPAIDRGRHVSGITDSYAGRAPDLGRFESGS